MLDEINAVKEKVQTLELQLKNCLQANESYNEMVQLQGSIPKGFFKLASTDKAIEFFAKKSAELKTEETLKSKLSNLVGVNKCPTCNSVINADDIQLLLANSDEKINKIRGYLKYKDIVIRFYKLSEMNLVLQDCDVLSSDINKYNAELSDLSTRYTKAQKRERLANKINGFSNVLDNLEPPDDEALQSLEDKVVVGEKKLKVIENDIELNYQLQHLMKNNDYGDIEANGLKDSLNKMTPIIAKLNDSKIEVSNKISTGKLQNSNYLKVQEKIQSLSDKIVDLPIYEALVKAYGAKGLRIEQIKYLADCFCENLNKYANLLFVKPIKFSVNVDSTNFNIYYEMNNNPISDVCTLSGAESRSFMLLCLVSLLPFIPERVRTDTVILDEVESGMSEDTRLYINQGFYKLLLNIVPKIVIITPLNAKEYFVDSDREYYLKLIDKKTVIERIK